jgi:hypothetical protein
MDAPLTGDTLWLDTQCEFGSHCERQDEGYWQCKPDVN